MLIKWVASIDNTYSILLVLVIVYKLRFGSFEQRKRERFTSANYLMFLWIFYCTTIYNVYNCIYDATFFFSLTSFKCLALKIPHRVARFKLWFNLTFPQNSCLISIKQSQVNKKYRINIFSKTFIAHLILIFLIAWFLYGCV